MCAVSMVHNWALNNLIIPMDEDVLEEFFKMVDAAKKIDALTDQPDCGDKELIQKVQTPDFE